jgi:hypothetical protein
MTFDGDPAPVTRWYEIYPDERLTIYDMYSDIDQKHWSHSHKRRSHMGDDVTVRLKIHNQLGLLSTLTEIEILAKFEHLEVMNEGIETEKMEVLEVKPGEEFEVALTFRPTTIGELRVLGV